MCLIIYNPTKELVPEEYIRQAHSRNDDGFGVMWSENNRIKVIRGMFSAKEIIDVLSTLKGITYVAHFRMATCGLVDVTMTHPFKVLSLDDNDNKDLYLMHNGVLRSYSSRDGKSDTALFAENMSKVLREDTDIANFIFEKDNIKLLESEIGFDNKVVFMQNNGEVNIINEKSGHYEKGMWFSNSYSISNYSSCGYNSLNKEYAAWWKEN